MSKLDKIATSFLNIVEDKRIFIDEPMKNHTSIKAGGNTKYLIIPRSEEELIQCVKLSREISALENLKYMVMGNGSNLLLKDEGYNGIIIKITKDMGNIEVIENNSEFTINAEAGVLLSALSNKALENNLAGMEFLYGIPGTVGGAVNMNAGAYGGEIKDIISSCKVVDECGMIKVLKCDELELDYRKSVFHNKNMVLLSATFSLKKGDKNEIQAKMKDFCDRRRDKQPLDMPSFGSAFKRPIDNFAGKLIMDSGFSGYKVGGAMVSTKHCGFIVNTGNATSNDIITLMDEIIHKVKEEFNIILEPEVKII